jgi:adenine-specific DNA-methyltransferase
MTTPAHARYWAHSLLLAHPRDRVEALSRSIGNARVDLNPHQVDAALFALRSPYSRGVLLADEVGLGKTIEAALVLAQRWAERRRRVLLIVPATLRKQWQLELDDKFFLPSLILETKSLNDLVRKGHANPFLQQERIVICSYQFAYAKRELVQGVAWDLVVIDEAHRLRSIYKGTKTAEGIVGAVRAAPKVLLTATPLQNTLLELYGLVSILDPEIFGSMESFQAQFMSPDNPADRDTALRQRIQHVCKRTLRRQVLEYIPFTNRFTLTADFVPSAAEEQLYNDVSTYLQREVLVALPNTRRKLITLIMRKLLASSSAAIGATLSKFVERLSTQQLDLPVEESLAEDFETLSEVVEEWGEDDASPPAPARNAQTHAQAELVDLQRFVALAESVERDSKAAKLVEALPRAFALAQEKGAARKAVIFTESCKTQEYLFDLLTEHGYAGEIVLMNGSNSDEVSKRTYSEWRVRNEHRWSDVTSGSRSADMKAAIVEQFRERGTLLLATESAAEGVNLQFCSIVVNYDLPWNPQRIEQRIGRCHRYGQKSDVLVVNFLNRKNAADQRVFELLSQKFKLFEGVFGASDDVLGVVESGVDLEKSIASIYQDCRTPEQIQAAFDALQRELDERIRAGLESARRAFLENFDAEVHDRLRVHKEAAKQSLDVQQQMLLDLTKFALRGRATFETFEPRFRMPAAEGEQRFHLDWQQAEANGDSFFRVDHPLAQDIIRAAIADAADAAVVAFSYEPHASALERYRGSRGWLTVSKMATQAIGRTEEVLLVAACEANGARMDPAVAAKLFTLRGETLGPTAGDPPPVVSTIREELQSLHLGDVDARNEAFFEEEAEKLELRSEDLKVGLEREIKRLDKEIAALRREGRQSRGLEERLALQKTLRSLEERRKGKRRQYYEEQDHIDADQRTLIERMEMQLRDRKVDVFDVLTIQWSLS